MSIRSVANAAGVTPPSIYRHFADKTHLLFEVCARQFELLDDVLEEAVAGIDDPVEAMAARGRAYVRFGVEHPEHYRIMFMGPSYETPDQWDDILEHGLVRPPRRGHPAGDRRRRDAPPAPTPTPPPSTSGPTSTGSPRCSWPGPNMPWPDLEQFVDDHLKLCLAAHPPHPPRDPAHARSGRWPSPSRARSWSACVTRRLGHRSTRTVPATPTSGTRASPTSPTFVEHERDLEFDHPVFVDFLTPEEYSEAHHRRRTRRSSTRTAPSST